MIYYPLKITPRSGLAWVLPAQGNVVGKANNTIKASKDHKKATKNNESASLSFLNQAMLIHKYPALVTVLTVVEWLQHQISI